MTAYYNEIEPYAAEWLRNLIAAGHLPAGDVDTRSIVEVQPDDLKGYDECHFFAGIGGWPLALRMAGWTGRPVWTGSCPCQPFSAAGKQRGTDDERHLWPEFFRLIAECRPATVFGEQVASKLGREWLTGVFADLESVGYAAAGADLCAASVGAPHIRQRLWWVADASKGRREIGGKTRLHGDGEPKDDLAGCCADGGVGNTDDKGLEGRRDDAGEHAGQCVVGQAGADSWVAHSGGSDERGKRGDKQEAHGGQAEARQDIGSYVPDRCCQSGEWMSADCESDGAVLWLPCADGKARRIEPGIEPLAHGVPARVGKLRAYGNAIVPQVASAFVSAVASVQNIRSVA